MKKFVEKFSDYINEMNDDEGYQGLPINGSEMSPRKGKKLIDKVYKVLRSMSKKNLGHQFGEYDSNEPFISRVEINDKPYDGHYGYTLNATFIKSPGQSEARFDVEYIYDTDTQLCYMGYNIGTSDTTSPLNSVDDIIPEFLI